MEPDACSLGLCGLIDSLEGQSISCNGLILDFRVAMESPMHGAAASTLKSTETVNSIKGEAAEGGLKQI